MQAHEFFGSTEQHEAGANAALGKIQMLLASKYPNCVVSKETLHVPEPKENQAVIPYLVIKGPKVHVLAYAGAYCDFTVYDFNHGPYANAVFTSGPAVGAKDRKIKPLSWSITRLDAYLAACHAE